MRLLGLLAVAALAMGATTVASAHVTPTPSKAPAGSSTLVAFSVRHGCEGSPTRQLSVQTPAGVTRAQPRPKAGWKVEVDRAGVIRWSGGLLRDGRLGTFEVRVELPATVGRTVYFPVVQRCLKGITRWIQIPAAGQAGTDRPAPGVLLTRPTPASS